MDFNFFLILPPVVFIIVVVFMMALSWITGKLAYKSADTPNGKVKAYACGEDVKDHRLKPDYADFFPVAFFFTIMHVITLVIAATPYNVKDCMALILFFIATAYLSVLIIFGGNDDD